jgi:Ser/Thr protein kinase RdoA (MazF antagonist)
MTISTRSGRSPNRRPDTGRRALAASEEEHPLDGGNITTGVVRVGDTVRRPLGPWSPVVHRLLVHLEEVGFAYAPRFLGIDDRGREILTFHEGATAWPNLPDHFRSDGNLVRAAELVADYHRAAASFVVPAGAALWPGSLDPAGGTLLLHGDLAPWNVVIGDDEWVLIDWDTICLGRVEWELAYVLHTFVDLWPESPFDDRETGRRLRVFADAYGMDAATLDTSLDLVAARCRGIADFTIERAALGDPAFVRMRDEGHPASWSRAANHAAERVPTWKRLASRLG